MAAGSLTWYAPLQTVEGIVLDVGWYRTTIRSFEREIFNIPNSVFSRNVVLNVTRKNKEWRFYEFIGEGCAAGCRCTVRWCDWRGGLTADLCWSRCLGCLRWRSAALRGSRACTSSVCPGKALCTAGNARTCTPAEPSLSSGLCRSAGGLHAGTVSADMFSSPHVHWYF